MANQTTENIKAHFKQKDMLTLADFTKEELFYLIEYGIELKKELKAGIPHHLLSGKTLAMIFEKASTRTRVSFETGMYQLGGHALFLSRDDIQIQNGETIPDTAKVLSGYVDGIMIRTFSHESVEELADNASIPIINGLTDNFHPCQVLADLMTIYEKKGSLDNLKFTFVGDGYNMANSILMGCAIMGLDCTVAIPEGYQVDEKIMVKVKEKAKISGAKIVQTDDVVSAVGDADVIYTDVWASMGHEEEAQARNEAFKGYQVNAELVKHAKEDFLFMHCLPAHREQEVSADVIDGANSVVFDEAENRLHIQKAIMASVMAD